MEKKKQNLLTLFLLGYMLYLETMCLLKSCYINKVDWIALFVGRTDARFRRTASKNGHRIQLNGHGWLMLYNVHVKLIQKSGQE